MMPTPVNSRFGKSDRQPVLGQSTAADDENSNRQSPRQALNTRNIRPFDRRFDQIDLAPYSSLKNRDSDQ
jgi:hypothetical protein